MPIVPTCAPCTTPIVVDTGSGSVPNKLTLVRAAGTGNLTMSATSIQPAFILVEDIGAA